MSISSRRKTHVTSIGSIANPAAFLRCRLTVRFLLAAVLGGLLATNVARAQEAPKPASPMETRIKALLPELETYIRSGMKAFDVPGLAIGIVTGDRLVHAQGFGVRSKRGGVAVDSRTVFQAGSLTKAFLATTIAIAVDRGQLRWDDRVVDLDPNFQLKDPWVTREFRVFDLLAQRSGLPPYANDPVGILGFDEAAMIRSLRHVEPVSSFRTTFAYTNLTHILAGRIVAKTAGQPDWNAVLARELLGPLGMTDSSYTADAIKAAANRAEGYRWTPTGTIEIPFIHFPYIFGAAGDINSTVEDLARWVRLQLGKGTFEGRRIVSPENLAVTRTPRVAVNDKMFYANGWVIAATPNGNIVGHDGGTYGFGSFIAMSLDKDVGVIVLTNEEQQSFPNAIALWAMDRLLDNPVIDNVADTLKLATAKFAAAEKMFAKPANPRPFPPLAPLAGNFVNPSFGKAALRLDGDGLVLALQGSGAELKLEPWDGDVFTVGLAPAGRFAAVAENMGPLPMGFVQFQIDKEGRLGLLRLSFGDGQAYEFRRE
jgi:CubicO group peptidase (beta-lactamase class C family)